MSRLIRSSVIAAFALALSAGTAAAQDPCGGEEEWSEEGGDACGGDEGMAEEGGEEGAPAEGGEEGGGEEAAPAEGEGGAHHGMLLPTGKIAIHAVVEANLSTDFVFKPFSLAPDIWYGVNEKLMAGLIHSAWGATGFLGGVGSGLCLAGEDNGCPDVYSNVGFEGVYLLKEDAMMSLAADGGVHITNISDPMMAAVKLGIKGQYRTGQIHIGFAPNIFIGVTERDAGNKEVLYVPVSAMYAVDAKISAGIQTGIWGPLDGFGDAYVVPLSIGGQYMVSEKIGVGGAFSFMNIAGKNSDTAFRSLNLIVGYML